MKIKQFLPIFSYIFHPIFISLYGTLFYFLMIPHYNSENMVYLTLIQVSILTLFLPLALYFLLVSIGQISSFTEASIKERRFPVFIQAVLLFSLISMNKFQFTPDLHSFFVGGFISAVLAFVSIIFKYKSSLHMIGISSLATFIYLMSLKYELPFINIVAFSFVCVGLVASSRLYMKSHTVNELLVGSIIGFISQYGLFYYFYNI